MKKMLVMRKHLIMKKLLVMKRLLMAKKFSRMKNKEFMKRTWKRRAKRALSMTMREIQNSKLKLKVLMRAKMLL